MLDGLRERSFKAGIILDFDGTLSPIAPRPDLARPVEGAREALGALVGRYAVIAVVTGRPAEDVAELLGVQGVRYEGVYGIEDAARNLAAALLPRIERAAAVEPAAWVEDKGVSVAVHYRQAADPERARARLLSGLEAIAGEAGLSVVTGKMVLELVPAGRPMKGGTVERVAREARLEAVLYAGDDTADLEAFRALDSLAEQGIATVRVAVRGAGTPPELVEAADVVVDGPPALVGLLTGL